MYAIYLRKSRADQEAELRGEGETLSRHRTALEALARRNRHAIREVYAEVVSGETISGRPEMCRLLADVAAGKYSGVYVMEVERLARGDTSDQGRVAETFMLSKTKIITPAKTYDPTNEFDVEYFEFSLFMSRREYKAINRRIQAGRMASIREGKYICSRPAYGYRRVKIPNDKGYTLEIIPEEADVVRWIYSAYVNTPAGITQIANQLADAHTPVGEQGGGWAACRIYRMLTNEVYIGKIRWGRVKTQREITSDGYKKRLLTQESYQLFDGIHEPIIDDDTFAAAQSKLHTPRNIPHNDGTLSNPLSGLVVCSVCGHYMSALPECGRQPAQLFCRTRGCPTVRTYRAPVERAILSVLQEWLYAIEVGHETPPARTLEESQSERIKSDIIRTKAQIDKLYDLLEQGVYTVEQYNERYTALSERIKTQTAALERANKHLQYTPISSLLPEIRTALERYDPATPAEKNALLKSCISKVEFTKESRGLIIRGHTYSDPNNFSIDVFPKIKSL